MPNERSPEQLATDALRANPPGDYAEAGNTAVAALRKEGHICDPGQVAATREAVGFAMHALAHIGSRLTADERRRVNDAHKRLRAAIKEATE